MNSIHEYVHTDFSSSEIRGIWLFKFKNLNLILKIRFSAQTLKNEVTGKLQAEDGSISMSSLQSAKCGPDQQHPNVVIWEWLMEQTQ